MCEYDPNCSKSDDPLAILLWAAPKGRALLIATCPKKRCPLAAVHDLPSGLMLCAPARAYRSGSLFSSAETPNEATHMHAALIPLSDYAEDELEYGRCACGTWSFRPVVAAANIARGVRGRMVLGNYVRMADTPPPGV